MTLIKLMMFLRAGWLLNVSSSCLTLSVTIFPSEEPEPVTVCKEYFSYIALVASSIKKNIIKTFQSD